MKQRTRGSAVPILADTAVIGGPAIPGESTRDRSREWLPAALILIGLALLVAFTLREAIAAGTVRLPGRDSGNLYVWEVYTRSVFASGRLPHWNPYHFAGTPHLADPQTTVLYPPAMLLRWLPPILFLGWMMALHVWLAGAGTLCLGRVIGLRWLVAATAAVAVMLGGSMGAWFYNGHLLLIYSTAWLPFALSLAILSVRRARLLPHPALVVVIVLQFLAGYLQGSLYVVGAVCLYFLYSVMWPDNRSGAARRVQPLAQLAVLGVLAIGLSAFQLWPTARLILEAGRTGGMPYHIATEGGWGWGDLATVFFPFAGAEAEPPHRYIGDRVVYVGWVLACLVPFAFFDRSRRRLAVFFAGLAIGAAALTLADALPFYRLHHLLFPGLRVPGRVLFVATLSLAAVGAIGLERFIAIATSRMWRRLALGATVSAIALAGAVAVLLRASAATHQPAHMWPWLPLVALAGLCAAVWLAARGVAHGAFVVVLIVVAVDVVGFATGSTATVPVETPETLRQWLGPPDEGRAVSVCQNMLGAGGMLLNGQPGLDGLAGLHLRHYADWAYMIQTGDAPPHDGMFRRVGEVSLPARRDLLDFTNVTTLYSCQPLDLASIGLASKNHPLYTYRNHSAWPRAFWTCDAQELPRAVITTRLVEGRYASNRRLAPRHYVNVRWSPGISAEHRSDLEARHQLHEGALQQDSTWRYVLGDPSASNGLALISNAAVEDTAGLDRATGGVIDRRMEPLAAVGDRELLIGTKECAERGDVRVLTQNQPDGSVSLRVNAPAPGLVFLSEPYYSERKAFVDGSPVTARKANLAFTAVPVPAGSHRVELRHVPRSFYLGLATSALTVIVWIAVMRRAASSGVASQKT